MEKTFDTSGVSMMPDRKKKLTEKGASPQIPIPNYNETATDALGRRLISHREAGAPKKDKYVGLFYLIWTDSVHGFSTNYDVTKAYACDPENPSLGKHGDFCWWAEPETGYHAIRIEYANLGGNNPMLSMSGSWELYHSERKTP